jgi:PAS domain S-box-containing protein
MVRQEAAPPLLEAMSLEETQQTLHELRVHQIELEMQNAELRRAQVELTAARERDFHLYDQAPVGYVTVSEEGLILAANFAAAALLGVARGALVERRLSQFIPPDDQDIYYFHRRQLLETGVRRTCELRMLKGDGTAFWTIMATATAPDAEGVPVSYVTLSDITERKRREEQLHKLNRTLNALGRSGQALMRATGEAEFLDEACRIVCEDCGYAMVWIGFAADDDAKSIVPAACAGVEGKYLGTLKLTWADGERGRDPTGTAVRTGQVCRCLDMLADPAFLPWREQARQGGYASAVALPLLAGGKAFGALTLYSPELIGFADDEVKLLTELATDFAQGITWLRTRAAKEQAEEAVRESEERYRALFETMTEGFALHEIVTDAQGRPCDYRFLDVNPAFERLTGLRRDDLLGRRVLEVLPGTEPHWIENYGRVALTGEALHLEEYSAALARWYDVSAYRVASGRFAVVFADISSRKSADEKISNLNRDIEERVRERTAELRVSEGRLRRLAAQFATAQDEEQQRIAEALHDDVAQVLAACSVKLAVATASVNAAASEKCHAELKALLDEANEKVRLMSFELGTATLYRLGIEEAVRELGESMEERHGIRIAVTSDGAGRRLDSAAAVVLYKAVRELLFNVVKHAGTHAAAVSISGGAGQLTVAVEDRGKGFTHSPSAAGGSVGSGLGLFGIRERVGDLGGTVHIESEPGVLTRVTITAPLGGPEQRDG